MNKKSHHGKIHQISQALVLGFGIGIASASQADVEAYGKTYGQWAALWEQWAYAGPKGANAIEDETGEFCASNQSNSKVWFLAGTFKLDGKPPFERTCTIPANRALFYPLIEGAWTDCPNSPDELLTDIEVRDILVGIGSADHACNLTSTVDGHSVDSRMIPIVRTQSPKYSTVLPANHILNAGCATPIPPGRTGRQITQGSWVMVPPLSPGQHTLTIHGSACDPSSGSIFFENAVTYRLNVKR
jgi:hypothetical protein